MQLKSESLNKLNNNMSSVNVSDINAQSTTNLTMEEGETNLEEMHNYFVEFQQNC